MCVGFIENEAIQNLNGQLSATTCGIINRVRTALTIQRFDKGDVKERCKVVDEVEN